MTNEQNIARNAVYNQMIRVPHREYAEMVGVFSKAMHEDPLFVSRACVHLATGGTEIRDQADAAIIALIQTPNEINYGFREAGRCLLLGSNVYKTEPDGLQGLPPFRIFRVLQFISKSKTPVHRQVKGVLADYIEHLQNNEDLFDRVAVQSRKDIKWAYRMSHIKPSARAQAILFDSKPPKDSVFYAIQQIAKETDIVKKALAIAEDKRIPYRIASSIVGKLTPETAIALISTMTPTEALNSQSWVKESGVLNIPEVRELFEKKVAGATKSIASASHRKSAQVEDAGLQAAVAKAKQKSVDKSKKIEDDLLIAVDRSGSMQSAIEAAKEFGMRIAPVCEKAPMVVVFNNDATELKIDDVTSIKAWETAFAPVRAGGQTSMESALRLAKRRGFEPTTVVFIGDGGENAGSVREWMRKEAADFRTVFIKVSSSAYADPFSRSMQDTAFEMFEMGRDIDYYVFDQVTSFLQTGAYQSLSEKIMDIELPRRVA